MKVYVRTFAGGKIEVRSGESLEREQDRLEKEYLDNEDIFEDFLDSHYCASDFYKDRPDEQEISDNFEVYCKDCARYDTFGQYKAVIVDEDDQIEEDDDEELPF